MKRAPKHPADGLYYITTAMLRKMDACSTQTVMFRKATKSRKMVVTAARLHELFAQFHPQLPHLSIAVERVEEQGKFTRRERAFFNDNYTYGHNPERDIEYLMDTLLMRAKREGRVK